MSGLEIAGAVLGGFPVALALLEKYREVCQTCKFWWQIKREYAKCRRDLVYHQTSFTLTLKALLLPLAVEDAQLDELIKQPGGELWRDNAIALQLKARLSGSYELYLEIIQALKSTVEDVQEELSFDKEKVQEILNAEQPRLPKAPKNSYRPSRIKDHLPKSSPEYELYRVKFAFGKSTRKELFDELKSLNERLEKLLHKQDKVSQLEKRRTSAQNATISLVSKKGDHFWEYADRLYQSLAQAWKCNCQGQHCAKLLLQHRWQLELDFMMIFLYKPVINHLGTPEYRWILQEANVKALGGSATTQGVVQASASAVSLALSEPSHRTAVPKRSALRVFGQKRRAREITSTSGTTTMKFTVSNESPVVTGQPSDGPINDAIQSLCVSFSSKCSTACFGFLEESDTRYYLYPVQQHAKVDASEPITLAGLLDGHMKPPLTRRQRFSLALTVASSFMQLRGSNWMRSSLSKADISFLRDNMNPNVLLLDKPYITKDFARSQNQLPRPQNTQNVEEKLVPHIKTLGVMLLELCFGRAIGSFPERTECPEGDEKTKPTWDNVAAEALLEQLQEEAGPDYANAVRWCISDSVKLRLSQKGWRTEFCEQVVLPLEECYKILSSSRLSLPRNYTDG